MSSPPLGKDAIVHAVACTTSSKSSLKEWLNDRNVAFVVISILVVYALERCAKNLHNDLVTPTFHKFLHTCGWDVGCSHEERPIWQKITFHILELLFTILILYVVSRYAIGHGKTKGKQTSTEHQSDVQVIHVHRRCQDCQVKLDDAQTLPPITLC
jgi:hypothetical protein